MQYMTKNIRFLVIAVTLAFTLGGCARIGPDMMHKDRFDYTKAVGDSWKEQVLLNIVRIRYSDWPTFVTVDQIITAYTMEHTGTAKLIGRRGISDVLTNDQAEAGWVGKFAERPTVLYKPLSGQKYVNAMLTPAKPASILSLISSGWPADHFSRISLRSVNGYFNSSAEYGFMYRTDPEFEDFISMLAILQKANALKVLIDQQKDASPAIKLLLLPERLSDKNKDKLRLLKQDLGLDLELNEYQVVRTSIVQSPSELYIQGRSLLQVLVALSTGVEIPESHYASGEAPPMEPIPEKYTGGLPAMMTVRSGTTRPDDAYVAVEYSDMWFWIDKTDHFSKRSLQYALTLITLLDSNEKAGGTVVIPAN